MTDLYYLSQADGVGEWRMKEAKDLSDLVQNRITYLQVSTDIPAATPTGPLPPHSLMYTHIQCPVHTLECFPHTYQLAYAFLGTSFTLARLICTIHNCQHQLPEGAGELCDSRLFQQLDLTSRILVACQRFSDTHKHTRMRQSTDTHCDLQNDRSADRYADT